MKHNVLLIFFIFINALFCPNISKASIPADVPENHTKAIRFATLKQYSYARKIAKETQNIPLIKLIEWIELTDTKELPDFESAKRFIDKNADWPRIYVIRRQAELALLKTKDEKKLLDWFKKHPPVSVDAVLAYVDILFKEKKWEKALPILHNLWANGDLTQKDEEKIKQKYGYLLKEKDFYNRSKKLLSEKKKYQAKLYLPLVPEYLKPLIKARIDLLSKKRDAIKKVRSLPKEQQINEDLLFDKFYWLRAKKKYDSIFDFLKKAPKEKQISSRWWTGKAIVLRYFLSQNKPRKAYEIAKNHGFERGGDFADAEWLSGWIALQWLDNPKSAQKHFEKMQKVVSSPLSVSRAEYWLGRSLEAQKKQKEADLHYKKASKKITTIYGQLAFEKIKHLQKKKSVSDKIKANKKLVSKLKKSEQYKVMKMLETAKQQDLAALFATRIYLDSESFDKIIALTSLLESDLNRQDIVVSISRKTRQNNQDIGKIAYPIRKISSEKNLEKEIVLSIIRQESSFSETIISPVGARGLMQLMPATAKEMARKKRKKYTLSKLTKNPDFNTEMGSAYIASLLKRYDGNYILAIAAYNAGPSNVNKWIKQIGKPNKRFDDIDWIENIPFSETRNYVQRVLENLYIYRTYLNSTKKDWKL